MIDMWPLRVYSVRYASTNQANSAFHPSGVGKVVVIYIIILITGAETIKRQTGAAYVCLIVEESLWTQACPTAAAAAVCGLRRYVSVICLCLIVTK